MEYGWIIVAVNALSAALGVALMQISQWHRSVGYRLTTAFMLCALAINSYLHLKALMNWQDTGSLGECLLSVALLTRIFAGLHTNNASTAQTTLCAEQFPQQPPHVLQNYEHNIHTNRVLSHLENLANR